MVDAKLPHRSANSVVKLLKDILGNAMLAKSLIFVNDQRILIDVIMRELTQSEVRRRTRRAWTHNRRAE